MTSPLLTVIVLAVLWLVVVVPMVMRRKDDRADERSVERFGRAMRALGSRKAQNRAETTTIADPDDASYVLATTESSEPHVFVSGVERPAPVGEPEINPAAAVFAPAARRPVAVGKEAQMFSTERGEMSAARAAMMARRRRSLSLLGAGAVVSFLLAVTIGGKLPLLLTVAFVGSLGGYLYFLRSQAMKDRMRRETRLARSLSVTRTVGSDLTTPEDERYASDTVVRLDDDNIELVHMEDTVDLTGVYDREEFERMPQRRAG
jgi:hypothetical protein